MKDLQIDKLELNKILSAVSEYAVLDKGKTRVLSCRPSSDIGEVRKRLEYTFESDKLLYNYGVSKIEYFGAVEDFLVKSGKGAVLSLSELLSAAVLLRSARNCYESIAKIADPEIHTIKTLADNLYFDKTLEDDIQSKIISEEAVSDTASEKLYSIRHKIKSLNEKIRGKLSEYVSGKNSDFLQDSIVTIRNDRFVIPVKAEYKNKVKGFVHDKSKTGATFFIEPEYVLELNNELIDLTIDEREEIENILKELSERVGKLSENLISCIEILAEIDSYFAFAEYGYNIKGVLPKVNDRGYINIIKGRHPLIDQSKVVPVSLEIGDKYNILLLSGANTGGKTVTMKMTGLFCLMAACGLYIPAASGSSVCIFKGVYSDIGDSQSIEEELSTFSSHMENIVKICDKADKDSLVLIDELGGGTNPDEGQALAKAVVKYLLNKGCRGIITTHFTPLKEFAYSVSGIENANMEFDSDTLKPLYRMKIGIPGASNAFAIAKRLGMNEIILDDAVNFLSDGARSFENILRQAEESRIEAEKKLASAKNLEREYYEKLKSVDSEIEELNKEREKIARSARSESRRIIADRTLRAKQILSEIEEIFHKEEISESDIVKARTLKNKLSDIAYQEENQGGKENSYEQATKNNLSIGSEVYIKPMDCRGRVVNFSAAKGEAEVACGSMKAHVKIKDLFLTGAKEVKQEKTKVKLIKNIPASRPLLEINLLGLTVQEALYELDNFIDKAVTDNLEEIKVIHGVGTGKLKSAIAEHLKKHKNVESFRLGKYGEGETGVTFVKLR